MAPIGGIGQQLDQLKGLSIQELMQRQSVDPQLVYALALQEKQKMEAAKERQAAMGMQAPQGTEIEKMEADLASRRAPGVQMAAQRSMPQPQMPQPQMSQGIAGVPSPNMGAVGRAQGGIIGYLEGGGVEGYKAQAPKTISENQRRAPYLDPALEKFLVDLETLNAQKDAAAPQEKDLFEQKIQDLLNTASPKVKRMASEVTFGLPKKSGMAMGGEVKGFAGLDGSLVSSPGYPMPFELDGKYYINDGSGRREITKADADAVTRLVQAKQAEDLARRAAQNEPVAERPFNPDIYFRTDNVMRRQRAAEDRAEELRREQEREERRARQARERDEAKRAVGEGITKLKDVGLRAINTPLNFLGDFITDFPKNYGDLTQDTVQLAQNVRGMLEEEAEKRQEREFVDETGRNPPTREQKLAEILQPAFDAQSSPSATTQAARAGQTQTGFGQQGISSVMQQETPKDKAPLKDKLGGILDGLIGVGQVLGRGAGASKGYETSKIAEEGRRIRSAEADRQAGLQELQARLKASSDIARQEMAMEARENIRQRMEFGDLAEIIARKEEELKDKYSGAFGFGLDEERVASELEAFKKKLLEDTLRGELAAFSGVSGQAGLGDSQRILDYSELENQ